MRVSLACSGQAMHCVQKYFHWQLLMMAHTLKLLCCWAQHSHWSQYLIYVCFHQVVWFLVVSTTVYKMLGLVCRIHHPHHLEYACHSMFKLKIWPIWVAWYGFECSYQWLVTMIFFPEIYTPPIQEKWLGCNLCSEQHLHKESGNRPMSLVLQ
jgi:hypothetical protein